MILSQEIIESIFIRASELCLQRHKIVPYSIVLLRSNNSNFTKIYCECSSSNEEDTHLEPINLEDLTQDLEIIAENRKLEIEKLEKEKRRQRFLEISKEYENLKKEFGEQF